MLWKILRTSFSFYLKLDFECVAKSVHISHKSIVLRGKLHIVSYRTLPLLDYIFNYFDTDHYHNQHYQ
jgi:hypothetical protein